MAINKSTVQKVAELSAIEMNEQEEAEFTQNLSDILEYMGKLSNAKTEGIAPTLHVHGNTNAFRADVTKTSLNSEQISKNAPDFVGTSFRVPRIISNKK